jgi:branched-chain amino acid transport system substrate-binding protein
MKKLALLPAAAVLAFVAAGSGGASPRTATAAANALVKCGNVRTVGFLAPKTGPAASLGVTQIRWVQYYFTRYNATHKKKFKLSIGDTKLGGPVSAAVSAAQFVTGNQKVLGVVGPAGSQEVVATTATMKNAGLGFVSGSATRTTLTTDGARKGYFFRAVPPDALQSKSASSYMTSVLKVKRVYIIDDQEAYSTGLADEVEAQLKAKGVSVSRDSVAQSQTDFSSLIAKIPRSTQLVYIPWQLPPRGQAFGRQLKSAGKASIKLFGSDGLFDPAFSSVGSNVYDSFFPVQPSNPVIVKYRRIHSSGDYFGAPSYVAAQVVAQAIDRACAKGSTTRAAVRAQIKKTKLKTSLLGLPVSFTAGGDIRGGKFGIYQSKKGQFARIG